MNVPNIHKLNSELKARDNNNNYVVNDAQLTNMLQKPGLYPSYLVLAEVERRKWEDSQRDMYKAMQEGAQPSVKDQAIAANQPRPQVPPHLMAAANPAPMSPEERASSGIAQLAGGGLVSFKDGGIVGFPTGGSVTDPEARPFTGFKSDLMPMTPEEFAKLSPEAKLKYIQMKEYEDKMKNVTEKPKLKDLPIKPSDITLNKITENITLDDFTSPFNLYQPSDYVPSKEELKSTEPKKQKEEKIQPININDINKDIIKAQEKANKADEELLNAKKSFPGIDNKAYQELQIDNPEEYARKKQEELSKRLNDNDYNKLSKEQQELLDKKLVEAKKDMPDLTGEGLLRLGLGMMKASGETDANGRPKGFFASLGESGMSMAEWLQTKKEKVQERIDKIDSEQRKVKLDLAKAKKDEEAVLDKYGTESEQFARAYNQKVELQRLSDTLENRKLKMLEPYYEAQASAYKGLSAQTSLADKKMEQITKGMGGAETMGMYYDLATKYQAGQLKGDDLKVFKQLHDRYKNVKRFVDEMFPAGSGSGSSATDLSTIKTLSNQSSSDPFGWKNK